MGGLICRAYRPLAYLAAKNVSSDLETQLGIVETFGITPWISNKFDANASASIMDHMEANCAVDTKVPFVISVLPTKDDCRRQVTLEEKESFTQLLELIHDKFPARAMIYVVEPGALSSLMAGSCNWIHRHMITEVVIKLSRNPMAEIYLDIDPETIRDEKQRPKAAELIQEIVQATGNVWLNQPKLTGFALNTGGYQSTHDAIQSCSVLNDALKVKDVPFRCVVDTSRNHNGKHNEWCNPKDIGIGLPPSTVTAHKNIPYYLWNTLPGQSDGACEGDRPNATAGPEAGAFFKEHFTSLWDNGWLKENKITTLKAAEEELKRIIDGPPATTSAPPPKPMPAPVPAPTLAPAPKPAPAPAPAPEPKRKGLEDRGPGRVRPMMM